MKDFLGHALANWQSSLSSLLTVTLVTTACLLTIPAVMQHTALMTALGIVQSLGKVYLGMIQVDAKK